ncbi:MAG: hypothetical protein V4563_15060 [Pseudomonadota bacterium]
MTREEMHDLLLGVIVVALGYAVWMTTKPRAQQMPLTQDQAQARTAAAQVPAQGTSTYNPANPAQSLNLASLLSGAVHDISSPSDNAGEDIPTTSEIFSDMTVGEGADTSGAKEWWMQ